MFEVPRHSLEYIDPKLSPSSGFGEDGMTQGTGMEPAFLGIANLENQLHESRIVAP